MIQAIRMKIFPGCAEEYKNRHKKLWPEMRDMLRTHGISVYHIFLDEQTNYLFAYLEISDLNAYQKIAQTSICQKWWQYMKDIMETNDDASPISQELKCVFTL